MCKSRCGLLRLVHQLPADPVATTPMVPQAKHPQASLSECVSVFGVVPYGVRRVSMGQNMVNDMIESSMNGRFCVACGPQCRLSPPSSAFVWFGPRLSFVDHAHEALHEAVRQAGAGARP